MFVEDGLGPVREEWRLDLPLGLIPYLNRFILYAGMAIPYLRYRNTACMAYALAANGQTFPLVEVQDVDKLLRRSSTSTFAARWRVKSRERS